MPQDLRAQKPTMLRRLGQSLVLLIVLSVFSFALVHIMPGDFAELLLIDRMGGALPTRDMVARFSAEEGFDDPVVLQYPRWLWGILRGEPGVSFQSGDGVWAEIGLRVEKTMILAAASIAVSLAVAVPLGILAAAKRDSRWDRLSMVLAVAGMAVPNFWYSLIMVMVFALFLGWLPVSGHGHWTHVVLPALVIGTSLAGVSARFIRSCVLDVLTRDFVRTARSKGLREIRVLLGHALPNALVPIVTLLGLQVCVLVVGAVYIAINLAVDLLVMVIDPRIRGAL